MISWWSSNYEWNSRWTLLRNKCIHRNTERTHVSSVNILVIEKQAIKLFGEQSWILKVFLLVAGRNIPLSGSTCEHLVSLSFLSLKSIVFSHIWFNLFCGGYNAQVKPRATGLWKDCIDVGWLPLVTIQNELQNCISREKTQWERWQLYWVWKHRWSSISSISQIESAFSTIRKYAQEPPRQLLQVTRENMHNTV